MKSGHNFILHLLLILYMTALDCTKCFQYTGTFPAHSPLLGNTRNLRTSNTIWVFQFKVIINQNVRTWFTLSSALANTNCEGFSITHIF